jgi:hypothetical protein
MTDLAHLSFARCTIDVPRVLTNAERMQEYRRVTQPEPINSVDWEARRKAAKERQVVANVVPITKRRKA